MHENLPNLPILINFLDEVSCLGVSISGGNIIVNIEVMLDFSYRNESARMLVLRCIGPYNFFLERALFPAELLVFSAPEDSKVEIWGDELYGATLEHRMRVKETSN